MGYEQTKAARRRYFDGAFHSRYFVGDGIDIGGGPDPLGQYAGIFPAMGSVRTWDLADGDAQHMAGVADASLDFVHSSHCLEHLHDPREALRNWLRIVKPGGYVVVTVPDEDLYELGHWPSRFNGDHKWSFTICKTASWSPRSLSIIDLVRDLADVASAERIQQLPDFFRDALTLRNIDQTGTPVAECAIEFVLRRHRAAPLPESLAATLAAARAAARERRPADAAVGFRRLCWAEPSNWRHWTACGVNLFNSRQRTEALAVLKEAIRLNPRNATAQTALGATYLTMQRFDDAEIAIRAALALEPGRFDSRLKLAKLLSATGRNPEGLAIMEKLVVEKPDDASAWNVYGLLLAEAARQEEAITAFRRAVALDPQEKEPRSNLGLSLLLQGEFAEAWPEYEARIDMPAPLHDGKVIVESPHIPRPEWRGEPLAGKSILLLSEQGYGDVVNFCRFAPQLAEQGARVIISARPALRPLLRSLAGVAQLVGIGKFQVEIDHWAFMLGAARYLGINRVADIPARVPYLAAETERLQTWQERLAPLAAGRRLIGLAWAGSNHHSRDRQRSLRLAQLAPLATASDICFVTLSPDKRPDDPAPADFPLIDCTALIKDFADVAAIAALCELVISVDSAPAHVAGALGRPVWTLLPQVPDWRWLLEREDSPWYPTMRLFRQPRADAWSPVIERVAAELRTWRDRVDGLEANP